MTANEKNRKVKLICLILIVNSEYARRKPFKHITEIIQFAAEQAKWINELQIILSQQNKCHDRKGTQ